MTPKYLLETSFLIDYFQQKEKAKMVMDEVKNSGELGTSAICLAEVYEGAFYSYYKEASLAAVANMIRKVFQTIWNVDKEIAKEFGLIRGKLRKKGQVIDDLDIFISATCLIHNLVLVTFNLNHFKRIPDLKIYRSTPR